MSCSNGFEIVGMDPPDIKILRTVASREFGPDPTVTLSSGTCSADSLAIDGGIAFGPNAFVPLGPWRPVNQDDCRILYTDDASTPASIVAVVQLFTRAEMALFHESQCYGEVINRSAGVSPSDQFVNTLLDKLDRVIQFRNRPSFHGFASDPVGLHTVSYDESIGKYVGLHVDTWDGTPSGQRKDAKLRVCINIGEYSRFFIFLNRSVVGMYRASFGSEGDPNSLTPNEIGKAFLSRFPSYPIVRLEVHPGCAYVAPTENILHDGCTLDVPRPVYHTAFRGLLDYRS
ncbi:hypothetical protein LB553_21030 [Mesorhizobium sp. CA8]|uniref:hypothetical protein n=1 Tax=Mesorhizobium sp. CA8 TaxID=2876637 RepID=UPI001CCF4702|nr:hypothetical protein [Mesorhizobium sp. CA8]MBZ9763348.1 hypothetical protein [Mesorhizobium sp. CA8]